jgi:hypothetical protein
MLTIHPPSFIETEDCDGPRYIHGQPSRETPGVLMTEMQNKYITEFELPYRNIDRYIKEIANNWNRLDDKQRALVQKSFRDMGMAGKMEMFGTGCKCKGDHNCLCKEKFGDTTTPTSTTSNPVDPNVASFVKFLTTDPVNNPPMFMNALWNSTSEQNSQMGVTNDELSKVKDSMYKWSVDNSYVLHSNWRSGLILFFFILIIFILIIVASAGSDAPTKSFGRSLFGRH